MAKITKRLCLPVGSYMKEGAQRATIEYRDIGVVMEFSDREGNTWEEVKLNLDILNPSLLMLAKPMVEKGSSAARVKLFDAQPRAGRKQEPEQAETPAEAGEDGIPY